jgi:hypothetical protein
MGIQSEVKIAKQAAGAKKQKARKHCFASFFDSFGQS